MGGGGWTRGGGGDASSVCSKKALVGPRQLCAVEACSILSHFANRFGGALGVCTIKAE